MPITNTAMISNFIIGSFSVIGTITVMSIFDLVRLLQYVVIVFCICLYLAVANDNYSVS